MNNLFAKCLICLNEPVYDVPQSGEALDITTNGQAVCGVAASSGVACFLKAR